MCKHYRYSWIAAVDWYQAVGGGGAVAQCGGLAGNAEPDGQQVSHVCLWLRSGKSKGRCRSLTADTLHNRLSTGQMCRQSK